MALQFRRGADEIAKANEGSGGGGSKGNFIPYAPKIFWQNADEERYVLFLNPLAEIPRVEMINFIPNGNGYEQVIARTDPAIGEKVDPMVANWDAFPADTNIAVAVELEPEVEQSGKYKRPKGFTVKTRTYERRVRDEDGELTDETEEMTTPVLGFITQSPRNFFNVVSDYDSSEGEIEKTPLKIKRLGKDSNTTYTVKGYEELPINLSGLLDNLPGFSYLNNRDEVIAELQGLEDLEAAHRLGEILLEQRLEELADQERYNELYEGITESLDKFGRKAERAANKKAPARKPAAAKADPEPAEEAPEGARAKIARLKERAAKENQPAAA